MNDIGLDEHSNGVRVSMLTVRISNCLFNIIYLYSNLLISFLHPVFKKFFCLYVP